jgi:hypothetical protein
MGKVLKLIWIELPIITNFQSTKEMSIVNTITDFVYHMGKVLKLIWIELPIITNFQPTKEMLMVNADTDSV